MIKVVIINEHKEELILTLDQLRDWISRKITEIVALRKDRKEILRKYRSLQNRYDKIIRKHKKR